MLQPSTLKLKVCKFLKLGIREVAEVQEWANCLFVRFRKGYKFFVRFVSKKALLPALPQESGLFWITLNNHKTLVYINRNGGNIDVYTTDRKQRVAIFDEFQGQLVRGWVADNKLCRDELRAIDFESYRINTNLTLRSTSKAYVPLGSLA